MAKGKSKASVSSYSNSLSNLMSYELDGLEFIVRNEKELEQADEKVNDFFGDSWEKSLTKDERDVIEEYSGGGYVFMNGALRHGNIKGQDEDIATMDKAIAKADLKEDIIVRRLSSPELLGLKTNSLEEFNKANLIGAIVSDKAYVSTAVIGEGLMKYNSSVSYRIKVPKGKGRGAYISNVAKIRGEFEYVIKRGSSFRITGARKVGKFLQVDMEVIDE